MIIIPIGIDCTAAQFMSSNNIRNVALPFDWVVTYNGVTDIIKNKFENYVPTDNNLKHKPSQTYFMHNNFPNDIDAMERRSERFIKYLENSTEELTFVRVGHAWHHHCESESMDFNLKNDVTDMEELYEHLQTTYPQLKFKIILFLACRKCFKNKVKSKYDNMKIHMVITSCEKLYKDFDKEKFTEIMKSYLCDNIQ
jgi:hypothetical protein